MNKNKKGFTLIELLVVIAIIGILATIVLVSLNTARSKARDARRVSDVRQIQLAVQMYYDSNGAYPAALNSAGINGGSPMSSFLSVVPADPTGAAYLYCVSATMGYHLGTTLENTGGSLNSDADIADDDCATGTFAGTDPVYDVVP